MDLVPDQEINQSPGHWDLSSSYTETYQGGPVLLSLNPDNEFPKQFPLEELFRAS